MLRFVYISILLHFFFTGKTQTIQYNDGLTVFKEIKNGKQQVGFKDKSGKVVIPARFDSVASSFYNGQAIIVINQLYGTIDLKGKQIIAADYKNILPQTFELTPVQNKAGLWGFYNAVPKLVIPCLYNNFRFTNKGKQLFAQQDGKWGMISLSNEILVPFNFKSVESVSPKQIRGVYFDTWERISFAGITLARYEYDSVLFTTSNELSYYHNGWQGLLNLNGSIALKNNFEALGDLTGDFVATKQNSAWGVKKINTEGWIIEPAYDIIHLDSLMIYAGLRVGRNAIHWKLYSYSGTLLYPNVLSDYHGFANGLLAVKSTNNKWGFINEKGEDIIPFLYSSVGDFYYGLCTVKKDGQDLVINKSGDVVLNQRDIYLHSIGLLKVNALQDKTYNTVGIEAGTEIIPFNEIFVKLKKGERYGLINTKGEQILPIIYSNISIGSSTKTVSVTKDKQIKVIQLGGSTYPVDKKIVSLDGFYNEYACMKYNNGKYGYVDHQGKIRIAPQYDQARPFDNGVAIIMLNGKWGIINKYEGFVAQPYYDSISNFKNNVAVVVEKGIYYLMNQEGKILTPDGYNSITRTAGGNYLLIKNNFKGIANANGKEIISARYQSITELSPTLFKVTENGLKGVIDSDRKIILHIKYLEIFYNSRTKEFLAAEEGAQKYISVK